MEPGCHETTGRSNKQTVTTWGLGSIQQPRTTDNNTSNRTTEQQGNSGTTQPNETPELVNNNTGNSAMTCNGTKYNQTVTTSGAQVLWCNPAQQVAMEQHNKHSNRTIQ
jgi:hypothetical protein